YIMSQITNILFITTDQQRQDSLPCYGLDFMQTPALDRLAHEGIVFDTCVSPSPVCQPARASFTIGQYPHVHGVPDNFRWIRPDSPTIARLFNQAGWHTAAIGKMHYHPWDNPEGFQYRVIAEDKRHIFRPDHWTHYLEQHGYSRDHPAMIPGYADHLGAVVSPLPEALHIDSFLGDEAVRWIETLGEQPFFGWISFNSPHDPYDPPESLADLYQDAPIPEAVGSVDELADKPPYQRNISSFYKKNLLYLTDYSHMTAEQIRRMRAYYLATVTLVDKQIAKILHALEAKHLLDSTLIVFSSDHGDHLGDHGLPFKSTYYESALMVPLIMRGPGLPAGTRCASAINWIDLHATFLALAGIEIPDHVQGADMRELLHSPEKSLNTEAYSELLGSAMVRTPTHKLVLCDDGTGELYDLQERPLEVHNHFNDPRYREIQDELTSKLLQHLLAHSRYRSFGGGRHPSDAQRTQAFQAIQEKIQNHAYPGLR
ncbi:sulfatase-like hydrolase/transferase, partial [candidate division KSB3 bacterium]|nr:sulfatase-like hydrolase/transferase [candidate division KSB3 bacterium]MBD3326657.1 sulfatase-like hydrolase/transferase [candidate division KSB3 bacterium]